MSTKTAWRVSAAFLALVAAWSAWCFLQPVSGALTRPTPLREGTTLPFEITATTEGQTRVFRAEGQVTDPEVFRHGIELQLLIATYGPTYKLTRAVFDVGAGACVFSAPAGVIVDNASLNLHSIQPCQLPGAAARPFRFEMVLDDPTAKVAFWTFKLPATPGIEWALAPEHALIRARVVYPDQEASTAGALLLFLWRDASHQVVVVALLALVLMTTSLWLLIARGGGRLVEIVAPATLFFGLCLWHSAVTPPYHAPDEPDHFLSLASTLGIGSHRAEALAFAQYGHFARIERVIGGQFRPLDRLEPSTEQWTQPWQEGVDDSGMSERSPLTAMLWRKAVPDLGTLPVEDRLLVLRLVDGLIVSLALATLCAAFSLALPGTGSAPMFLFASAPTLPFFAMAVSNYPLVIAIHLVMAALLVGLLRRSRWDPLLAFLAGTCVVLATVAARPGFATLVPLAVFIMARVAFDAVESGAPKRGTVVALGRVALPFWVGLLSAYFARDVLVVKELVGRAIRAVGPEHAWATPPIVSTGLLATTFLVLIGGAAVLSAAIVSASRAIPERRWRLALRLLPFAAITLVLAAATKSQWQVPDIEADHSVGLLRYVWTCLKCFTRDLGWAGPDTFVSQTFWVGFGWLDVATPTWLARAAKLLPAIVAAVGWIWARDRHVKTAGWIIAAVPLLTIYMALLAGAAYVAGINLHGRYLIGFYVFYISVAAGALYGPLAANPQLRRPLALGLFGWIVVIQAVVTQSLMRRYF